MIIKAWLSISHSLQSVVFSELIAVTPVAHREIKLKLEIWGRAQLEAARRPKSDWKYNFVGCNVSKNLRRQHPLTAKI